MVPAEPVPPSRRTFIAGGAAAIAVAAGAAWWLHKPAANPRVATLIDQGEADLRYGLMPQNREAAGAFRQAIALNPRDATPWGLVAYAQLAMSDTPRDDAGQLVEQAELSARHALALDPDNADGQLTLVLIKRSLDGRAVMEDALRKLLTHAPQNPRVILWLDRLLQGAGRTREAWLLIERLIAVEPVSPTSMMRKALKLWVFGRSAEAQQVSLRTMDLWPSHLLVRNARLMICAFTGRTQEALALVEEEQARPLLLTSDGIAMWRASLKALETRSSADIAAAKEANLAGATTNAALAAYALLCLSALGELDAAFDVANGFLLSSGPLVVRRAQHGTPLWLDAAGWRNTLGIFTPPTKVLRLDPRFKPLSDGLGLTDYWHERGGPDSYLFKA